MSNQLFPALKAAYCGSGGFRSSPYSEHLLRHSAHPSLQSSRKSPMVMRAWPVYDSLQSPHSWGVGLAQKGSWMPSCYRGSRYSIQRDSSHDSTSWAGCGVAPGNRVTPRERGYRIITPHSDGVWFLQPVFCCTQKSWCFTSDSGLASFESCAQSEQVQDANSKVHFVSDPTARLVCDHRSKGCILSHPDRQETQENPQVRFRGQSLPVFCSSVWTGSGPSNIYKVYGCSSGPIMAPGHLNFDLLGRLTNIS